MSFSLDKKSNFGLVPGTLICFQGLDIMYLFLFNEGKNNSDPRDRIGLLLMLIVSSEGLSEIRLVNYHTFKSWHYYYNVFYIEPK